MVVTKNEPTEEISNDTSIQEKKDLTKIRILQRIQQDEIGNVETCQTPHQVRLGMKAMFEETTHTRERRLQSHMSKFKKVQY